MGYRWLFGGLSGGLRGESFRSAHAAKNRVGRNLSAAVMAKLIHVFAAILTPPSTPDGLEDFFSFRFGSRQISPRFFPIAFAQSGCRGFKIQLQPRYRGGGLYVQ